MLQGFLIGHLGGNAECKTLNGKEFVTFRVAHTNKWTDDDGNVHEETTWVDCILTGNPTVIKYLVKGQLVFVAGTQTLRIYSSKKDRCMKAGLTINVRQVELLGGKVDEVPSVLYNPADNSSHDVRKYYYAHDFVNEENPSATTELVSRSNERFVVDGGGWVQKLENEE